MGVSWKRGVPLVIIHFNEVFLYKPSSYGGTPMTVETSTYRICYFPCAIPPFCTCQGTKGINAAVVLTAQQLHILPTTNPRWRPTTWGVKSGSPGFPSWLNTGSYPLVLKHCDFYGVKWVFNWKIMGKGVKTIKKWRFFAGKIISQWRIVAAIGTTLW